jgi:hypothetical protein
MKQMLSWEVISLWAKNDYFSLRETKYTLPFSQQPSTEFYPAPDQSNQS